MPPSWTPRSIAFRRESQPSVQLGSIRSRMVSSRFFGTCVTVFVFICALHLVFSVLFYLDVSIQVQKLFSFRRKTNDSQQLLQTTPNVLWTSKGPTSQTPLRNNTELCPAEPPNLVGPQNVTFSNDLKWKDVRARNPKIQLGGRYKPPCVTNDHVAIIIPYRQREEHLKQLLLYLHPFLQRQQINYAIYIVNQFGDGKFNRAKLMNVGYKEALKDFPFNCFIFSDVDLIPMDDHNFYHCYSQPRHFSVAIDKHHFRLIYPQCFGGVSGLSKEQFIKINGFPNNYWGWGGEDDDVYHRIILHGMKISRPARITGRYRMIKHGRDANNERNPKRLIRLKSVKSTMKTDGINSLKYQLIKKKVYVLFTNITVDVGKPTD
uniref:beta-1,4-galactosyltransferase 1-like n=1 Tax=Myxine glutinosa TaxID=7769 RepID=UPI00358FF6A0